MYTPRLPARFTSVNVVDAQHRCEDEDLKLKGVRGEAGESRASIVKSLKCTTPFWGNTRGSLSYFQHTPHSYPRSNQLKSIGQFAFADPGICGRWHDCSIN